MVKYSSKKHGKDQWEIWEHQGGFNRLLCYMSSDDILQLFNETVPRVVEEPFLERNKDCNHAWRPWKFNDSFIQCANCPAMKKTKKLVPRVYK
jgi:hypothetical protein